MQGCRSNSISFVPDYQDQLIRKQQYKHYAIFEMKASAKWNTQKQRIIKWINIKCLLLFPGKIIRL